jgi:ABC-type uncharacterized transport system ATPase subunit
MASAALELRGIVKAFPGVLALADVELTVTGGEVVALLGENGAGKTTLMSIAAGLYRPDFGMIFINGAPVVLDSPREAIARGVGMVHQHFRLIDAFTVTENVLLGCPTPRFLLNSRAQAIAVAQIALEHGLAIDPNARVSTLSVGERQRVEILKLLYRDVRILLMDEPTAVLTPQEVNQLATSIRRMAAQGRAVVISTHKLTEAMELADRIVVLRAGRIIGIVRPDETSPQMLAQMMVGQHVEIVRKAAQNTPGRKVLSAIGIQATGTSGVRLQDITLEVHEGEIVGVAGVAGNGQLELVEVLAGLRVPDAGRVYLDGHDVTRLGPRDRWARGLSYIPEDRAGEGLIPPFSIMENAILREYYWSSIRRGVRIDWGAARMVVSEIIARFQVQAPSVDVPVRNLSGGNQQRLLVGREIRRLPLVLVAMYPTRGLDVRAATELHRNLLSLRDNGSGIVLVSESLDELFALADRIVVLHRGRIVGSAPIMEVTREQIGLWMAGGR